MIHFTDMTGLAGSTVAMTVAAVMLSGAAHIPKPYRMILAGGVAIAALIPFGWLPLAAYVRGVTGDLSITTLVLLSQAISRPLFDWPPSDAKAKTALLILIALAAAGLYPMALGLGLFDPYRLGYGNPWFMGGLLLMALTACFHQLHTVALAIALAVFAWGVGWYESNNLWDYLLDPLLAIYAIIALGRHGMQILIKS